MKIIAFYLPQYYSFPENDAWWGKGFTEWTNVKKAKKLYRNHYEPRIPFDNNYYCLLDKETIRWQISKAKEYGVYAFCFYHYWFKDGKQLLEKPTELFLSDKSLDMKFCLSWANEPWSRTWTGEEKEILMSQEYGDKEEWKAHFNYLLDYFLDNRYLKIDNKPLFVFYRPEIFKEYKEMFSYWNQLAIESGFDGISFAIQGPDWNTSSVDDSYIDYRIMFEPGYTGHLKSREAGVYLTVSSLLSSIYRKLRPAFHINLLSYDAYGHSIVKRKVPSDKFIPGFFPGWDNTARRGKNGVSFVGASPRKFGYYMDKLIKKAQTEYKTDMIFINAWNEWAEGCYLEPDNRYEYQYLEELKRALEENDEFPDDL